MLPVANGFNIIENLMGTWGYPVLFGALFSAGLGVPLPEDIPLILAGYFVAIGKMHLSIAAVSAWLGIICGDCVLYSLGYHYGLNIVKVPIIGKHFTASRVKSVELKFQKYGSLVVAVGRMLAGVRGAMVVTAGTIRFNFIRFIIADGLGAIVSGGTFVAIGYFVGRKLGDLDAISKKIEHYEHVVIAVLAVLAVGAVLYFYIRHKHRMAKQGSTVANEHKLEKSTVDAPT